TLDALLRFCYPCTLAEDPNFEDLKDVVSVLEAAKKYSLDAIEKKAAQAVSSPKLLEAEPLRCFAIAHRGQLREETILAAKYTLRQPLIPAWFEEIELLTATDLLALLTYHKQCGDAVEGLRTDLSWITTHYQTYTGFGWTNATCGGCTYLQNTASKYYPFFGYSPLQWWVDFMEDTFVRLRDRPCVATIEAAAQAATQVVRQRGCGTCSSRIAETMREFTTLFAGKVEEAVSQVHLGLKF
ncbi:hypothetical protein HYDPIDRAFT_27522, partial [Hydnomerulius pinastri MD-312]